MLAAVVVNYRTALDTLQALRSLEASRRRFDRIFVVDDGSGDGSAELLATRLGRATLLRQSSNAGFPAAVDAGFDAALASGADRVLLLNSDALLAPDAIERLEAALDADPTAGIAAPLVLDAHRPGRIASAGLSFSPRSGRMRMIDAGAEHRPDDGGGAPRAARVVDGVAGCAMLIERAVIERIGGLDRDYFFSFEDLDFCLRARRAGWSTVCVPDALAWHQGSRSIGQRSPRRLYFAARNHLLLARRAAPLPLPLALPRALSIVALNLAHALRGTAAPRAAGLGQVWRGVGHHLAGRYGAGVPV
jgi:GT2 family glycosyltransferase